MNAMLARRAFDLACGMARSRRLLIFSFHRVLPAPDALLSTEPTAVDFASRLDWIGSYLQVLPLPAAAQRLREGSLPTRAACITFDDGYRNNAEIAGPMLDKKGMPASFFIATGAIERGAMWNDLVIEAVRRCGRNLDLEEFDLGVMHIPDEHARGQVLLRVLERLKYLPIATRAAIADALHARHCGTTPQLMMTQTQVRGLARKGHDVGAHTMTHPILQKVDVDQARAEIEGSRDWLAKVLGVSPVSFAYPNGRPGIDFDETHMRLVGEAGFRCAVSTRWGCATPRSNILSLERFAPWENSRSGFVSRILKTYASSYV